MTLIVVEGLICTCATRQLDNAAKRGGSMNPIILRIIHVSDLHLFVDSSGNPRSPAERARIVRLVLAAAHQAPWASLNELGKGLYAHSEPGLAALLKTIDTVLVSHAPALLVNTGDTEAYGITRAVTACFPAWDYWEREEHRRIAKLVGSSDVYGNHDVWPGTIPLIGQWKTRASEVALRRRPGFATPLPDETTLRPSAGWRVEVYRLSTVCAGPVANLLALGDIDTDPLLNGHQYVKSRSADPLAELRALSNGVASQPGERAVRILVMHHPPHLFDAAGTLSDLTKGPLASAQGLADFLGGNRFHIILAGHRHAVDPAGALGPSSQRTKPAPQPPLPDDTLQLVAGSATQCIDPGDSRPSFNVYTLSKNRDDYLSVEREIFRWEQDIDTSFSSSGPAVVGEIPL